MQRTLLASLVLLAATAGQAPAQEGSYLIFTTSTLHGISAISSVPPDYPNFGSIEGADWIATLAAYSSGLLFDWNGVDTPWRAIISTDAVSAIDRLDLQEWPIHNRLGELVATGKEDLFDGTLSAGVYVDEFGNWLDDLSPVWTGTLATGVHSSNTAESWTNPSASSGAQVGLLSSTDSTWLDAGVFPANGVARLYVIGDAGGRPIDVLQPPATTAPEPAQLFIWLGLATCAAAVARRRIRGANASRPSA